MNVILRRDVKDIGRIGAIVEVNDAYARNFLIAKGFGVPATTQAIQQQATVSAKQHLDQQKFHQAMVDLMARLEQAVVHISGKANAQGKLFAALKTEDVRRAVEQQYSIKLPGLRCEPDHFKVIGPHDVTLRLDETHRAQIKLQIDHVQ